MRKLHSKPLRIPKDANFHYRNRETGWEPLTTLCGLKGDTGRHFYLTSGADRVRCKSCIRILKLRGII